MKTHISVVIPAHNEEKYIARCIRSIKKAEAGFKGKVEIIVVCNRCSDRTGEIAKALGARVLLNEDRCIAKVRNTGIAAANGQIIVTIDADNRMTRGTLKEVYALLRSGRYIGGGAPIRFERYSFPLWCNDILCRVPFKLTGLYSGIFWAEKKTFDAIGGFVDKNYWMNYVQSLLCRYRIVQRNVLGEKGNLRCNRRIRRQEGHGRCGNREIAESIRKETWKEIYDS